MRDRYINVVHYIQTRTEKFKHTHEVMLVDYKTMMYHQDDYRRMPRWAK